MSLVAHTGLCTRSGPGSKSAPQECRRRKRFGGKHLVDHSQNPLTLASTPLSMVHKMSFGRSAPASGEAVVVEEVVDSAPSRKGPCSCRAEGRSPHIQAVDEHRVESNRSPSPGKCRRTRTVRSSVCCKSVVVPVVMMEAAPSEQLVAMAVALTAEVAAVTEVGAKVEAAEVGVAGSGVVVRVKAAAGGAAVVAVEGLD